jgi:hypothetical protein
VGGRPEPLAGFAFDIIPGCLVSSAFTIATHVRLLRAQVHRQNELAV